MMQDDIFSYKQTVINGLRYYLEKSNVFSKKLLGSVEYSLFSAGKFLRSSLLLDFCKLCCENIEPAVPFACAVEMIHTYSLIHDDLPCMDDDSVRRGKPSNHVVNGEGFAVLAGDALFSLAAEILTDRKTVKFLDADSCVKACNILFGCCGISGMVDGQALDLSFKNNQMKFFSFSDYICSVKKIHLKKTGRLFGACCALGCVAGKSSEKNVKKAKAFGEKLGVAYQLLDDLDDNSFGEVDDVFKKCLKEEVKKIINEAENIFNLYFKADRSRSYVYKFLDNIIEKIER